MVHTILLPDDREMLAQEMSRIADEGVAELLVTTGGTGFSPRVVCRRQPWILQNGGAGNSGSYPGIQYDDHTKSHAEPCSRWYPETYVDH